MTHQILIASYPKDFPWLRQCLRSIAKFQGPEFLRPVVAVLPQHSEELRAQTEQFDIVRASYQGPAKYPNLGAQWAMFSADLFCTGDFVWLVGSDCIFTRPIDTAPFFRDGKPIMLHNSYAAIGMTGCNWQQGVHEALGIYPECEFMRRLPLVYPRSIFKAARSHIETQKGVPFAQWPFQDKNVSMFSESNVLGAYAYHYDRDLFSWELLDDPSNPYRRDNNGAPLPMVQFWSHGGFDRVCDGGAEYPGGNTHGKTPRQVITEIFGGMA